MWPLTAQDSESLPEPPQEASLSSSSKPSDTPELDLLFQQLREEIESWGSDSETLLSLLQNSLTTSAELSQYLTQLSEQFESLSEGEKEMVSAFLAANVLEVRARVKAEKSARIWKGIGIGGLAVGVAGVLYGVLK
jgi:hypothetical protein